MILTGTIIGKDEFVFEGEKRNVYYVINGDRNIDTNLYSRCNMFKVKQKGTPINVKYGEKVQFEQRTFIDKDGIKRDYYTGLTKI